MKKTRNGMHIESNHAGLIGEHASRDKGPFILCESESLQAFGVYCPTTINMLFVSKIEFAHICT